MTAFFVPGAGGDEESERAYAELARQCGGAPLPLDKRIETLVFTHDGPDEWVATVGCRLSCDKVVRRERMRANQFLPTPAVTRREEDPATTWAIFDGGPVYLVVTDRYTSRGALASHWESPFMVSKDHDVRRLVRFES